MLISGRQAREILGEAGISDRRARIALTCGLAGPSVRSGAAHLYDALRVVSLGRRRVLSLEEVHERCPDGVFVSRRPVSVADPDHLRRELAQVPGQISPWTALMLWCGGTSGTKLLATVAGFVVLGATVREARGRDLVLGEPGPWCDGLLGAQLLTGKGRQWKILTPPRQPLPRAPFRSPERPLVDWDAEIDVENDPDLDPDL